VERPPHDLPPWGLVGLLGPDRDGAIPASRADKAPDVFKKMDTNEDGVISWDRSLPPKPMRKRTDNQILGFFKSMDADQNGKLSAQELGATEKRFRELDTDGNGFVTAEEFVAGMRASQDRVERVIQENRGIALSLLATLDADKDGKITRSEFGGLGALLKSQDLTGKGFVAREDLLHFSAQESPTTSTLTLPR